ncbi:hypothetical protein [Xenorhabdus bovienii]|nr:hypothetical protein [Xenorhabdus bovienii]
MEKLAYCQCYHANLLQQQILLELFSDPVKNDCTGVPTVRNYWDNHVP